MTDFEDFLSRYRSLAIKESSSKPLLTASDFDENLKAAGHLFVGCAIKWLISNHLIKDRKNNLVSLEAKDCTYFSEKLLPAGLFLAEIEAKAQEFCNLYFGIGGAYGRDYFDRNVTEQNRSSLADVPDNKKTFQDTVAFLEKRFFDFNQGLNEFSELTPHHGMDQLTDWEKTPAGWIFAMKELKLVTSTSEKERRNRLDKFWSLVDFSPEIASNEIALTLVELACDKLDDGLLESVRNSIADFPFVMAISAIFSNVRRLHDADRLGELLSPWSELDEVQSQILRNTFDVLSHDNKSMIMESLRDGVRHREGWAIEWNKILSE